MAGSPITSAEPGGDASPARTDALLRYHRATSHSPASLQSSRFTLDWPNQPLPFKIYTSLEPHTLPLQFKASQMSALEALAGGSGSGDAMLDRHMLARLCYFGNGVTRVLRYGGQAMPFRAAACSGAMYHIELYAICGDLGDLPAGVYHYGAHDNGLRRLRRGDYRGVLTSAAGVSGASAMLVLTSTWWRNAWKYRARAYRHAFWDTGTIVANVLAVASANGVHAGLVHAFVDAQVNQLLDVDPSQEAAICLVTLGRTSEPPAVPPEVKPLGLPTQRLSASEVEYPEIVAAHRASSLSSPAEVAAWRAAPAPRDVPSAERPRTDSIEAVILRRGSSRRFSPAPISERDFSLLLDVLARRGDSLTQPYLLVNAVDGLAPGAYVFDRQAGQLCLLQSGDFRLRAAHLDLGQPLGGEAAIDVYWLCNLASLLDTRGSRAYRAAQLEAAVEGGRLYLAAYALGLGASGLTFFDDDVIDCFSPHAAGKSVMFLTAVGHPARRRA